MASSEASDCKSLLSPSPSFLVKERVITEPLKSIISDTFSIHEGSHVVDLNRAGFRGQLGAYFETREMEIKANQLLFTGEASQYKVSGRLVEVFEGLYMFEITKLWKAPLELDSKPQAAQVIDFQKKLEEANSPKP